MAIEAVLQKYSLPASADLSASQYCGVVVNSSGELAVVGVSGTAIGILQDKPDAQGHAGSYAWGGVSKVRCGGHLVAGNRFVFNASGEAVAAGSGDAYTFGWMLEGGEDGEISTCQIQPIGVA